MKNISAILVSALAITAAATSESKAYCVQAGAIIAVYVTPGAGPSAIDVRDQHPGSVQWRYTTSDQKLINSALTAQASHQHVQLLGGSAQSSCSTPSNGLGNGGALSAISVGDVP